MEKFRGVDYYGVEDLLSEEERMVRDAVRDWVETEFLPVVTEHHRAGTFPLELIPKLGELGVFGATLKGYGCAGLNHVAYGLIMQELERGDSGLRSAASVQSGLVMYPIYAYGSEAQKEAWLPLLATGARVGCFGLTEPDHGSDPGGMKTRARREGGAYVLSGTKLWITNGSVADVAVVWAKEDDGEIGGFLGEPIAAFQLVQQKLVWMLTEITKAQLLVLQVGRLKDQGKARAQQISMAKMNNVQIALDTARMARDIMGAAGIVDEHPVIRHMLNLETVNTYEGTHDIHTLIIGRDITGLDAFGL